jgi:hypothetical protein
MSEVPPPMFCEGEVVTLGGLFYKVTKVEPVYKYNVCPLLAEQTTKYHLDEYLLSKTTDQEAEDERNQQLSDLQYAAEVAQKRLEAARKKFGK